MNRPHESGNVEQSGDQLADEVDRALQAAWEGDLSAFDQLIDEPDSGENRLEVLKEISGLTSESATVTEIGPFKIIRELGRGGMGVVYEALQIDPPRKVALKLIHTSLFRDAYHRQMFKREIRTLARLSHPGIAALYEAGQTQDGAAYFAMELVEGRPLSALVAPENVSRDAISINGRIEIVIKICDAIHFAHQRGVIHRDLKPTNILIDQNNQPKVLDFGLARLTEPDSEAVTLLTKPGQILGTLAYMSPEQACGEWERIDLRTDVYSIGVILYELLAGRPPIALPRTALHDVIRQIGEKTPPPLGSVNRSLRGDLETIAQKALEKDPERRYAGAAALADDLRRYLDALPISARPPSAVYQFKKLMRRHRLPFALASLLLVTVVVFAGVTAWQAVNLARQRDEAVAAREAATQNAKTTDRVNRFLHGMLSAADLESTADVAFTVRDVLDHAARRIDSSPMPDPQIESAIRRTLASSYKALGRYEEARAQLDRSLELRKKQVGDRHIATAKIMSDLGGLARAQGQLDEADSLLTDALSIIRTEGDSAKEDLISTLLRLGVLRAEQGELDQADALLTEAIGLQSELPESDPLDLLRLRIELGQVARAKSEFDRCELLFEKGIAAAEKEVGRDHLIFAKALNNLAVLLESQGKHEQAAKAHREARDIKRKLLPPNHPSIIITVANLATVQRRLGRLTEAERSLREAIEMTQAHLGDDHPRVAILTNNLAGVLRQAGDLSASENLYRDVYDRLVRIYGREHRYVAMTLNNLGSVLRDQKRLGEAQKVAQQALELTRVTLGADHIESARAARNLAVIFQEQMQFADAERFCREALQIVDRDAFADHPLQSQTLADLGGTLRERGRCTDALLYARRAIDAFESSGLVDPRQKGYILAELGMTLLCVDQPEPAARKLKTALQLIGNGPREEAYYAMTQSALGKAYVALDRVDDGRRLLREAADQIINGAHLTAWQGRRVTQNLIEFHQSQGQTVQAQALESMLESGESP